jgi:hypothetical protein
MAIITDVALVTGGVLVVGGLTWYLLRGALEDDEYALQTTGGCTGDGCGARVRLSF